MIGSVRTRRLAYFLCCLPWAFAATTPSPAQAPSNTTLHRRAESNTLDGEDAVVRSRGRTTLPLDASGEYSLGERGEAIEVDLQRDWLSGYVTRYGDHPSDQGTPLTFFFATSLLSGQQLSFTTHRIHSVWFSFAGTIVRGPGATRSEAGYYLLEGRLAMHDAESGTEQMRQVSLPMARQSGGN